MSSIQLLGEVFEALDGRGRELGELDDHGLAERLVALERVVRRAEAAILSLLDEADRRGAWKADGHASVRGWARATVRWSDVEVRDRVRSVRLCRDAPLVAEELRNGRLGVAQVRELARARANPRVGAEITDAVPLLVEHAQALPFAEFRICVNRWESLADVDGTHDAHQRAHAGRRADAIIADHTFHLVAQGGVLDGTAMLEILRRYEDAEFRIEWDELTERLGDAACPALLPRTSAQRRFDALARIFERAASAGPGAQAPEPVVNLVMDLPLYEAYLARMSGDAPDQPLPAVADIDHRRCETVDGVQVAPSSAVAASLVGHVRRVVFDAAGVVIDLSRRSRLFTGGARQAVTLQGTRCPWPGCGRPTRHVDHLLAWVDGGPTEPGNGAGMCSRHNLVKARSRYLVHRDDRGRWHCRRPDGSEIAAA